MTATERLRAMLDERGVEWGNVRNDGSESNFFTEWQFDGIDGRATATEWFANENLSITIYRCGLTPEQAIEATLGRGTCHDAEDSGTDFCCSACGARLYIDTGDTYTMIAADEHTIIERPNYCPNCGAEVVE